MLKRLDRWGAALFGAVLLVGGMPSAAQAISNCSFANGEVTIIVDGDAELARSNSAITLDGQPCGAATVTNTDNIQIVKADLTRVHFTIDMSQPFAPGATAESTGASEIEFSVGLGFTEFYQTEDDVDRLDVHGTTGNDNFAVGDGGVNTNGDNDSDLIFNKTLGDPVLITWIYGENGDDTISGQGGTGTGDPSLLPIEAYGGAGNDHLTGSSSFDYLEGGPGADALDGGDTPPYAGYNVAQYLDSTTGVNVNLTTGIGSGGDAQGDTFTNIDSVKGSDFADVLAGDANSNGLDGEGGADQIIGFDGTDALVYFDSPGGVQVDLKSSSATGSDAQGDSFSGMEDLVGSEFADQLTGDAGPNYMIGRGGEDEIDAGDGDDTLEGGLGNDVEMGGAGDDYFWAGFVFDNDDLIDGGSGKDYINYHGRGVPVRLSLDGQANDGDRNQGERDNITNVEKVGACTGNDVIKGSNKDDIVKARDGRDKVTGGGGDDSIDGGPGKDVIDAGPGRDICFVTKGDKTTGCEKEKRAH